MQLVSVWVKTDEMWKLLTISNDPITLEAALSDLPRIAQSLVNGDDQRISPASLVSPIDGAFPQPTPEDSYGPFVWRSSTSESVVVEIAEFHYGHASRLFSRPKGKVSAGELWSTGGEWSWRVWSMGKNGQIVLSDVRHFTH